MDRPLMKTLVIVAAFLAVPGLVLAADLPVKAAKAPAFDPWDIAFGGAIMSDYVFRGITQSNHQPSVAAYFEPRYNVNKDVQLYVGTSVESISFANHAAAEVDVYGGSRPALSAAGLGRLRLDHRQGDGAGQMVWVGWRRSVSVGRSRGAVVWNDGRLLSHFGS